MSFLCSGVKPVDFSTSVRSQVPILQIGTKCAHRAKEQPDLRFHWYLARIVVSEFISHFPRSSREKARYSTAFWCRMPMGLVCLVAMTYDFFEGISQNHWHLGDAPLFTSPLPVVPPSFSHQGAGQTSTSHVLEEIQHCTETSLSRAKPGFCCNDVESEDLHCDLLRSPHEERCQQLYQ